MTYRFSLGAFPGPDGLFPDEFHIIDTAFDCPPNTQNPQHFRTTPDGRLSLPLAHPVEEHLLIIRAPGLADTMQRAHGPPEWPTMVRMREPRPIRGHVRLLDGTAVRRAVVRAFPPYFEVEQFDGRSVLTYPPPDLASVFTGEDGGFEIGTLPEGTYRIAAQAWLCDGSSVGVCGTYCTELARGCTDATICLGAQEFGKLCFEVELPEGVTNSLGRRSVRYYVGPVAGDLSVPGFRRKCVQLLPVAAGVTYELQLSSANTKPTQKSFTLRPGETVDLGIMRLDEV